VVAFDRDSFDLARVIETIATVERGFGVNDEPFVRRLPYPGDREFTLLNAAALAADGVGVAGAVAGRLLHVPPLPEQFAVALSLIDSQPRLRRELELRLGAATTDFALAVANALVLASVQGPLGLVNDAAHRANLLAEGRAQQRVWSRREPALARPGLAGTVDAVAAPPRPSPLGLGPIEKYSDHAALASLGGLAAMVATTRDPL